MKKISVVIPVYNEEHSLGQLYSEIKKVFNESLTAYKLEIIIINDGSTDGSLNVLKKLHKKDKNLNIVSFRKNVGKSLALNQGFIEARGQLVVTMDGDLQDRAENIPLLVKKLEEGYDLVIGWKQKRQDPLGKIILSKAFNYFVRFFSGLRLHDFNSGLKVMKVEVAKEIDLYGGLHRFIPVLAYLRGFKITEVPVIHHQRVYGVSKYGWERLIRGFFDFLTVIFLGKFGQRPLHLFGLIGGLSFVLGLSFGLYSGVLQLIGDNIGVRALNILAVILVLEGIQLFLIGLLAEMIIRRSKQGEKLPIDYESKVTG